IGKWHLGDQPEFLPTRQGFDEFDGIPYSDDMTRDVGLRLGDRLQGSQWPELPLMHNEQVLEAPTNRDLLTKKCTEAAVAFIERHRDEPFFLYFPEPMPGSTSAPFASPDFKGKSRNGPWGDAIEELDWSAGRILDKLKELRLAEHTLVIWLSDNGAPTTGKPNDVSRGSNLPLYGRGYTTAEGAFRSPTLAWWPGRIPPGTTCTELATTMDLLPTFAELAGVSATPKVDGHDIRPLLFAEPDAVTPYSAFFYYERDQLQAVRSGPWKLFLPLTDYTRHPHFRTKPADHPLLFNVVEDIASEHDVAEQHPDVVRRLTALADQARADLGDRGRPGNGQRPAGQLHGRSPQPVTIR
ncbi:MAG: sulfatase-like hydrolase/transferase, partial [Planctomycetaceae bacterium]|nr:sulfatase-like hydrolase/transferase [Planctomycetaceae bacterium]